ncbi:MAG: hypothetical protein JW797_09570 [Bradymonadales bacterium]|nr:hypothetical protein [Bradymonadales bacterium]
MRSLVIIASLMMLATAGLVLGCNLDFDEAIPCQNHQHCPEGMYCQQSDHRCLPGSASTEDASEEPDAVDQASQEEGTEQEPDETGDPTDDEPASEEVESS